MGLQEAATRKLGPLPAWAWGAVVGGAILGVRWLTGGQGSGSSGTVVPIGGDGSDFDYGDLPDAGGGGDPFDNGSDVIGGALPGIIDSIADYRIAFDLQAQLNDAINRRATLIGKRAAAANDLNAAKLALVRNRQAFEAGKITRKEFERNRDTYQEQRNAANAEITRLDGLIETVDKLIDELREKLSDVFAAPAA